MPQSGNVWAEKFGGGGNSDNLSRLSKLDIIQVENFLWGGGNWDNLCGLSKLPSDNVQVTCSDITNTLVGISSETGPVAQISCFIEYTVAPPDKRWF